MSSTANYGMYDEAQGDVLIVGAGPSGLMSACLLARYGIKFRIVEKSPVKIRAGIQSRTLEVLETMGLRSELEKHGFKIREYTFWNRNAKTGALERTNIGPDVISPTPYPYTLAVDEGRLRGVLIDDLASRGLFVEYNKEFLSFTKFCDSDRMAIYVRNHDTGVIETWNTDFILGCDGMNSSIRGKIGAMLEKYDDVDYWAVADVTAATDIPDYRRRCTLRSLDGNCIVTPKADITGFRVRTLLSKEDLDNEKWQMSNINHVDEQSVGAMGLVSVLQARISAAISPFKFVIHDVSWICSYYHRKTLASNFANSDLSIFLLGSASHTHSPLTKQTMNSGMMDALNLTWKLAYYVKRRATRSLLSSYEAERRSLLVRAIEFDCKIDRISSMRSDDDAIFLGFHDFEEASGYFSGCGTRYPASDLVKEEKRLYLRPATETLMPGKRLLPGKLIRHIDGNDMDILEVLKFNGRFKLMCFVADCIELPIFKGLSNLLNDADKSPLRFNANRPDNHVLDLIMIHTTPHLELAINDLPQPWPISPFNIFEDLGGVYHIKIGLSPHLGGFCLARPDGYVAIISNLDNTSAVTEYLMKLQGLESSVPDHSQQAVSEIMNSLE